MRRTTTATVQLSYLNLIGSYMTAASQLNLAVAASDPMKYALVEAGLNLLPALRAGHARPLHRAAVGDGRGFSVAPARARPHRGRRRGEACLALVAALALLLAGCGAKGQAESGGRGAAGGRSRAGTGRQHGQGGPS